MLGYSEIGIFGSLLLAGAVMPQFYRLFKTRSAKDISLYYPLVLSIGSLCLTVYGFGIRDLIVFVLNLYATLCNLTLLLLKLYFDYLAGSAGKIEPEKEKEKENPPLAG